VSRSSQQREWSCLRRYVGLRVNVFRALHTTGFHVSDDRLVLALRNAQYALVARLAYDVVFNYFYVRDCQWYRCDLEKLLDEDVPAPVREHLVRQFSAVLS
jgi:hypothetical protein